LPEYYQDADGDGYGDETITQTSCQPDMGYVATGGDCNDSNNQVYSGAVEICDTLDNDCDGQIDEGVQTTYYQDADGDGYGNPLVTALSCSAGTGYVVDNTDCDDTNDAINPSTVWYQDFDGDFHGDGTSLVQCEQPIDYYLASSLISTTADCNDNN
jgi:hypothetical protein